MNFKIVAYDKQTHGSFPSAMMRNDYRGISAIQGETTWREIELITKGIIAALHAMDVDGIAIELMVINDRDREAFPLRDMLPEKGVKTNPHPQIVATRIHQGLTTTEVLLNNNDITQLMRLLPRGNGCRSGVREKLHQARLNNNDITQLMRLSPLGDSPHSGLREKLHQARLNNNDITQLMRLLPLGDSPHSGLREKLHQASVTISKKK